MISKESKGFGALQFLSLSSFCIVFGFCVTYFKYLGFSEWTIAIILAVTNVVTIIAQPLFGFLSDSVISVKKIITVNVIISAVVAFVLPFIGARLVPVFIIFLIISFTLRTSPGLIDSYATKLSTKRSGLNYGLARGIGSLGYCLTALAMGRVIDVFGYTVVFSVNTVILVAQLVVLRFLEDYPVMPKSDKPEDKQNIGGAIMELVKIRPFVLVTLASFIVYIGVLGSGTYLALVFTEIGGSNEHFGIALAVLSFAETPVLWNYKRIVRRFREKYLILFALVMYVFKIYLVTVFPSITGVIALQAGQAVTYALFLPSILRYVQQLVPERLTATAITLSASIYASLSSIIGTLLAGWAIKGYGVFFLFKAGTVFCVVGAAIYAFDILVLDRNT